MPQRDANRAHTVAVDSTGEIATFDLSPGVSGGIRHSKYLVELYIDAGETADFAVEFGAEDADTGDIVWLDHADYTYSGATVRDSWEQTMEHVRVMVTTAAATAGTEATLALGSGI